MRSIVQYRGMCPAPKLHSLRISSATTACQDTPRPAPPPQAAYPLKAIAHAQALRLAPSAYHSQSPCKTPPQDSTCASRIPSCATAMQSRLGSRQESRKGAPPRANQPSNTTMHMVTHQGEHPTKQAAQPAGKQTTAMRMIQQNTHTQASRQESNRDTSRANQPLSITMHWEHTGANTQTGKRRNPLTKDTARRLLAQQHTDEQADKHAEQPTSIAQAKPQTHIIHTHRHELKQARRAGEIPATETQCASSQHCCGLMS